MTKNVPQGASVSEAVRVYIEKGGKTANEGDNESSVASATSNTHKMEVICIDLKTSMAENQRTIMYQKEVIESLKERNTLLEPKSEVTLLLFLRASV